VFDSVLFIAKVVEDLENEQAEEGTPSFLCGYNYNKCGILLTYGVG
jgi:hypothetical protein